MKCELFRRHVDAYVDGEVDPSTQIDFERHASECARCQEDLAFVRAAKGHVRMALGGAKAPSHLRARVLSALDSVDADRSGQGADLGVAIQDEGAPRPWIRFLPVKARYAVPLVAVASLVLAVFGAADVRLGRATGAEQAAMPMFEDVVRLHSASLPPDVTGAQPQKVSSYFRDKVRFPVRPVFDQGQAELVGARLSNVRDHRAAALYYNVRGNRLTVVVFEAAPSEPLGPRTRYMGRELYLSQVGGYTVPVVRRGQVTYAFTGDVDRDTLLRLAAAARVQ
ncbi:MAG: zf-HC2 domain-containing protein [Polyangiales bacterium]|nr:zf-HC2 domain-containing protein [Myxococcales bacterium]